MMQYMSYFSRYLILLFLSCSYRWWRYPTEKPRPTYAHCLPIGIENRYNQLGSKLNVYIDAMASYIQQVQSEQKATTAAVRPLLLVAFHAQDRAPDRNKALQALNGQGKSDIFFNDTSLSHREWLAAIPLHRFTLAPLGHGLDTHRISEIFLMGGIPVMKRSSITSCYDDSDNKYSNNPGKSRGSLPIVVVDKYENISRIFLESEWERIIKIPSQQWDWRRLLIDHWIERIGCREK